MATATVTHTPGPWLQSGLDGDPLVITPLGSMAIDCSCSGVSVDEDAANARLIAAAPDLLAALKAMVASYDGIRDQVMGEVVKQKLAAADAAIARAEGR